MKKGNSIKHKVNMKGLERWLSGLEHCLLFQGPGFEFQHPYGTSQLPLTLVPRDLTPCSGLGGYLACMWCTDIHTSKHLCI